MKKASIPNYLTISRIVVILPIILLLYYGTSPLHNILALALSIYAMLTDFLDGYLSRKWQVQSDVGRLLDPIADKLLVAALLVMLASRGEAHPLAVTLILLREIFISGLREYMQEHRVIIHVTKLAKYKTTTQMLACFVLLMVGFLPDMPAIAILGTMLLWLATGLTLITGYDYMRSALKRIR